MTFQEKLKELREAKGWSQKVLAERSGHSLQAVAQWEQGLRAPSFAAVVALCKALGVQCIVFDKCDFEPVAKKPERGRPKKR